MHVCNENGISARGELNARRDQQGYESLTAGVTALTRLLYDSVNHRAVCDRLSGGFLLN